MDMLFRTLNNVVNDREACDEARRVQNIYKSYPSDQARVLLLVKLHMRQGMLYMREVMTDPTTDP